jgi:hypothetical protein
LSADEFISDRDSTTQIVRAHFNKRTKRASPRADHHLNISNTPIANSNIGKVSLACSRAAPFPTETLDEDIFTPDDFGRLL